MSRGRTITLPTKEVIKNMNANRARDLLKVLTGLSAPEAKRACGDLRDRLMELESKER